MRVVWTALAAAAAPWQAPHELQELSAAHAKEPYLSASAAGHGHAIVAWTLGDKPETAGFWTAERDPQGGWGAVSALRRVGECSASR